MQLDKRNPALVKAYVASAGLYCHITAVIPLQLSDKGLGTVHRLVEAYLDLAAKKLFKVRRPLELTLSPGRS